MIALAIPRKAELAVPWEICRSFGAELSTRAGNPPPPSWRSDVVRVVVSIQNRVRAKNVRFSLLKISNGQTCNTHEHTTCTHRRLQGRSTVPIVVV